MFLAKALLSSVIIPLSLVTGLSISPTVASNDDSLVISEYVTRLDYDSQGVSWTTDNNIGYYDAYNQYNIFRHSIYISFNDNHKHTGRITYQQSVSGRQPFIDDTENVVIRGNYIYFYDVMSIRVDYYEPRQANTHTTGYVNVTVSNLVNTTVDKDINDVYTLINSMTGTVTDIKTNTDTIISKLQDLIDGTSSSQSASDDLDDKTTDLSSSIGSLESIESSAVDDMTDALGNINVSTSQGIILLPQFSNAATWVKQQFDWITNIKPDPNHANIQPFGMLLTYSLVLGLGLFIIGRLK